MAHPLGRAPLRVKGGGPLGQLPELPDATPIEVGGVTLEEVGDTGAGCLAVVAEDVGIGSVA